MSNRAMNDILGYVYNLLGSGIKTGDFSCDMAYMRRSDDDKPDSIIIVQGLDVYEITIKRGIVNEKEYI